MSNQRSPSSRFRGRDAVTTAERDQPPVDDPALARLESDAARSSPDQLSLFLPGAHGAYSVLPGGLPPLAASSSLPVARAWYRRELEQARRPRNTIESYCYDLALLETRIGPVPIDQINRGHIARFLGEAATRTTRKRRLTSVRRFFRFLIDDARVLSTDPSEGYYPHQIQLRTPVPLFAAEQAAILTAAEDDEPWAAPAVWLMMQLGLTRSELLALRRDHIETTNPDRPVVYVFYEDAKKRSKERKLAADEQFARLLGDYLEQREPLDLLFPVGPPAVNTMVARVSRAGGITKQVTPQTLRHTFAVERAKQGMNEEQLLALLGLVDDPRNRESVSRYLKLAEPALG
jgi:integrase/recombinase XerD